MIPEKITFAHAEIDPNEFLNPRKFSGAIFPHDWTRLQIKISRNQNSSIQTLDRYIEKTSVGRWGSYEIRRWDDVVYVMFFEKKGDAVMFRLRGDEQFLEPEEEWE